MRIANAPLGLQLLKGSDRATPERGFIAARGKGSPMLPRWGHAKVVEVFGADLRSLATFRIVLAVLVLLNLADRVTDLSAHYSDYGVLPRIALLTDVMAPWQFSLNLMNGEPFFQALVFGAAALAALALLLGYRTRLATVVAWVTVVSIVARNPLLSGSEAVLLSLLLFWAMFLPLGAHWSVDRALKDAPPRLSMRFLSMATVGLFLQIAFVYWFTAILKSGPEWRVDGTALYYALSYDHYARPIATYLLQFPELLKILTFATLALEAFGPFFLFFPFFTGPVRTGAVLAFMSLHFGIWLTLNLGWFPWIAGFCMVCFLPTWFWDSALPKVRGVFPGQPAFVRRHLRGARGLLRACLLPLRSLLSLLGGVGWRSSTAGLAGYGDEHDQPGSSTVSTPSVPSAKQGESRSAMTPGRGTRHGSAGGSEPAVVLRSSLATNLLAAFFLLYVLCWNITTVSSFTMPERLIPLGNFLGLGQQWQMFTAGTTKYDYWHVIPGTLRGGQQVDLMAVTRGDYHPNEGVSWEKPRYVRGIYENGQWQGYLDNIIAFEEYADLRWYFNRYLCREWNARHSGDEQLVSFQMVYVSEETQPDYQPPTLQTLVLWEHSCS
jgi:Vitamin K-dependent gamma-carboxylase